MPKLEDTLRGCVDGTGNDGSTVGMEGESVFAPSSFSKESRGDAVIGERRDNTVPRDW